MVGIKMTYIIFYSYPNANSLFSFEGQLCTFTRVLFLLGRAFTSHLKMNTTMFIVLCRLAHADGQNTDVCLYVIGKYNIM